MTFLKSRAAALVVIFLSVAGLVLLAGNPVSTFLSRVTAVGLCGGLWLGMMRLCWSRVWLRGIFLGLTCGAAGFLAVPFSRAPDAEGLRAACTAALRSYAGTPYKWGGESRRGIDCSGLVRCGMRDALLHQALTRLDPSALRAGLALWWQDRTAAEYGAALPGVTEKVVAASSLNEAPASSILPGDLAVTANGRHILACLDSKTWIQADPLTGSVDIVRVPAASSWFQGPMTIVRWKLLTGD